MIPVSSAYLVDTELPGSCKPMKVHLARHTARLHQRIRNGRVDALHKLTTRLIDENQVICLEDLNVSGMVKNRHLAQAIADSGFGELRRQLAHKAEWCGRTLIVVDRWYPSSKTCSCCGHVLEALALSVRHWTCPACAAEHDRDENAARNIRAEALRQQVPGGTGELRRVEGKSAGPLAAAGETRPGEARIVHSREAASGMPANGVMGEFQETGDLEGATHVCRLEDAIPEAIRRLARLNSVQDEH